MWTCYSCGAPIEKRGTKWYHLPVSSAGDAVCIGLDFDHIACPQVEHPDFEPEISTESELFLHIWILDGDETEVDVVPVRKEFDEFVILDGMYGLRQLTDSAGYSAVAYALRYLEPGENWVMRIGTDDGPVLISLEIRYTECNTI
jgi:hypothetical protein